jgi:AcrR family transcriptional regulator
MEQTVTDPSSPSPTPRRGRPRTISDAQILLGARRAVLARGPHVTTRELARFAGVSEGTLFRRYRDKRTLVRDALGLDEERLFEPFAALSASPASPLETLETLIADVLRERAKLEPLSAKGPRGGLSSPPYVPPELERRCAEALARFLAGLGGAPASKVCQGLVGPGDIEIDLAARTLVTMLLRFPDPETVRSAVGVFTRALLGTGRPA